MKISEHIKFLIDYRIRQNDSNKMMQHNNNLSTIFLILLGTLLLFATPITIFAAEEEEEGEEEAKEAEEQKDPEEIEKVQEEITELETEINEQKTDGKEVDTEDLEKLNELQNELKTVNGSSGGEATTTTTTTTSSSSSSSPPPPLIENTSATTVIPTAAAAAAVTPETCNCTQLENGTIIPIEPPIVNSTEPEQPEPNQIIITKDMIKDFQSTGEITNQLYTKEYNATNTVDNLPTTFWSQYGGTAGFTINLKPNALKNYEVCSAEVNVHDPKTTPFTLTIGSKTVSGVLDTLTEKPLQLNANEDECIANPNKIALTASGPDKYTSLSEVKLFGNLLQQQLPTTVGGPPIIVDGKNISKIDIKNSKVEINIENSEVTFNFGSHAFKLLPNAKVVTK